MIRFIKIILRLIMGNKNNDNFIKNILSGGNGVLSSKRVFGSLIILVVLGCTIALVIKEGGTEVVENLLTTAMILGASLLGISSVTNIWKKPTGNKSSSSSSYEITFKNEESENKHSDNTDDTSSPQSK